MDIKKVIDTLVNKGAKKEEFNFLPKNYTMKETYDAEKLVIGKLEYISNDITEFGPMVKKTMQNYIFESIVIDGTVKYQEVFTGFIAGDSSEGYFCVPYVVDAKKLTEVLSTSAQTNIPKLGMLLLLNNVNTSMTKNKERKLK